MKIRKWIKRAVLLLIILILLAGTGLYVFILRPLRYFFAGESELHGMANYVAANYKLKPAPESESSYTHIPYEQAGGTYTLVSESSYQPSSTHIASKMVGATYLFKINPQRIAVYTEQVGATYLFKKYPHRVKVYTVTEPQEQEEIINLIRQYQGHYGIRSVVVSFYKEENMIAGKIDPRDGSQVFRRGPEKKLREVTLP